mgnify:CR=1 FL=1
MKKISKHIILIPLWIALTCLLTAAEPKTKESLFRFGAVADCQYCKETSAVRKYNLSPQKLTACVEYYNKLDLAFVVHLGDFIDRDFESFAKVTPIYNRLKAPHYHVLGNHEVGLMAMLLEIRPLGERDTLGDVLASAEAPDSRKAPICSLIAVR